MTLLQLQYFITVCRYQSFTKAARELSISQPGISYSMKELEEECGFPLFEHRPNSIRLTEQGSAFLREAKHMISHYDELTQNTRLISREKSILRIGVATMGAGGIFPKLRKGFYRTHPEITFQVTEDSTESLYHQIDTGELDLALCVSITLPGDEYSYVTVGNSRLMFCIHEKNPLAKQKVDSLSQLGKIPLIMLSDRYSQTKYLKRLFRKANYTPNVIQYTSQVFTILQHIRENAAGGFLSEDIAASEPHLVSIPLHEVDLASVTMIWRKDQQTFAAMNDFIRYIRNRKI